MYRVTNTGLFCPRRCTRSIACCSMASFHHVSIMKTSAISLCVSCFTTSLSRYLQFAIVLQESAECSDIIIDIDEGNSQIQADTSSFERNEKDQRLFGLFAKLLDRGCSLSLAHGPVESSSMCQPICRSERVGKNHSQPSYALLGQSRLDQI